jgi:hypothetical protein
MDPIFILLLFLYYSFAHIPPPKKNSQVNVDGFTVVFSFPSLLQRAVRPSNKLELYNNNIGRGDFDACRSRSFFLLCSGGGEPSQQSGRHFSLSLFMSHFLLGVEMRPPSPS